MNTVSPHAAMPERFNWLESMLFAPQPTHAARAAERYAGHMLASPATAVSEPTAPTAPHDGLPEPAELAMLDI